MKRSHLLLVALALVFPSFLLAQSGVSLISQTTGDGNWGAKVQGVAVSGDYAYLAVGDYGLVIMNISNPADPQQVGHYETDGAAKKVFYENNMAYIADGVNGLVVVNVTDRTAPTLYGAYATPGGIAEDFVKVGTYGYIADGANGMIILDLAHRYNPVWKSTYTSVTVGGEAYGVTVSGDYAYLAYGANGLEIVNISDLDNPALTGSYNTLGSARKVALWEDCAYVADYNGDLRAINVSNPVLPALKKSLVLPGYAYSVTSFRGYALVSAGTAGLRVVEAHEQTVLTEVGYYDTDGTNTYNCTFIAPYAYVADGSKFGIYDCSVALEYDMGDVNRWVPTEYLTIQKAIDAADDGDSILVRLGTYRTYFTNNGKDLDIVSAKARWDADHSCPPTLSLADMGRCVILGDGSRTLVNMVGSLTGTTLAGFKIYKGKRGIQCSDGAVVTIRHCHIRENSGDTGAGVTVKTGCDVTLDYCQVEYNTASNYGGGVGCSEDSKLALNGCTIKLNTGTNFGGGVWLSNNNNADPTNVTIDSCYIGNNKTRYDGGAGAGIYAMSSTVEITRTEIVKNIGPDAAPNAYCEKGGGLYANNSTVSIDHCTFAFNKGKYGFGIYLGEGADVTVTNSILWDDRDQEVFLKQTGTPSTFTISYTDIRGGVAEINYLSDPDIGNTVTDGFNNIGGTVGLVFDTGNPLFVNNYTNFHLQAASPCIGVGSDGDMGKYEFGTRSPRPPSDVSGNDAILPESVQFSAAYPNPFNAETRLDFALPETAPVSLVVYDLNGRRILGLVDGIQAAGYHSFIWNGRAMPTGTYLIRFETPGFDHSQQVMLIK